MSDDSQNPQGLVAPQWLASVGDVLADPVRRRYRQRFKRYHAPVLRYLARVHLASAHTVLARFWVYDGAHPGHGERVLTDLRRQGLIDSRPIVPYRGRASRRALALTRAGYAAVGVTPPARDVWSLAEGTRWHLMQHAEMLAIREAEGWQEVRPHARAAAVRRWASHIMARDARFRRSATELAQVSRLRGDIPLEVLRHVGTGDIRLVLPVRRGLSVVRLLGALPSHLSLVGELNLEIVCAEEPLLDEALLAVRRWAKRRRLNLTTHEVGHFLDRRHPRDEPIPSVSLYEAHGQVPLLMLDRPEIS